MNLKIAKFLGLRLKTIETKIQDLLFCDTEARVYNLLCKLAKDFGEPHAEGTLIKVNLTQKDIGNLVKASRQRVSESITRLKHQGKVKSQQNSFIVLNTP